MLYLFLIPAFEVGFSDHMVRGHYLISAKTADECVNLVREIASDYTEYGIKPVLTAEKAKTSYIVGFTHNDVTEVVKNLTYEAY